MKNKLYLIINESLKKYYKTHYFLCIGEKELFTSFNFGMKQLVNIHSGTIVESAVWKVGYDIQEVIPTDEQKEQIEKILNKKRVANFIERHKL